MDLGQSWFIINIFFVAALITTMFFQRSYVEGVYKQLPSEQLSRLKRRRDVLRITAIVLFVVMAVTFLSDMRVNG